MELSVKCLVTRLFLSINFQSQLASERHQERHGRNQGWWEIFKNSICKPMLMESTISSSERPQFCLQNFTCSDSARKQWCHGILLTPLEWWERWDYSCLIAGNMTCWETLSEILKMRTECLEIFTRWLMKSHQVPPNSHLTCKQLSLMMTWKKRVFILIRLCSKGKKKVRRSSLDLARLINGKAFSRQTKNLRKLPTLWVALKVSLDRTVGLFLESTQSLVNQF